jgi:hypothetical protein
MYLVELSEVYFFLFSGSPRPVFVFHKKVFPPMYESGPPEWIGLARDTGWMTGSIFLKLFSISKATSNHPQKTQLVLLLLDDHSSHLDYRWHLLQKKMVLHC